MGQQRIKLAAFDLDDTLLLPEGTLSERARAAIEKAADLGMEIVLASGRSFSSLPAELLGMPQIHYAITSNGAAVNEVPSGKRILARCLRPESIRVILKLAREEELVLEAFVEGIPYAWETYLQNPESYGCPSWSVPYVKRTRRPCNDMEEFLRLHEGELDSVDLICRSQEQRLRYRSILEARTGELYMTTSVPHLLELSAAGGGKGSGLAWLCGRLGISREETAACGNGDNDADMLLYAAIGGAVANASEVCRKAADILLPSNGEEGAAVFLERLMEENEKGEASL